VLLTLKAGLWLSRQFIANLRKTACAGTNVNESNKGGSPHRPPWQFCERAIAGIVCASACRFCGEGSRLIVGYMRPLVIR
jgi:hypothetical protein